MLPLSVFSLLVGATAASAHIALFHPSMYGFNYPLQATDTEQNYRSNEVIKPLSERPLAEWWAHGMLAYPPAPGNFLELPAGGSLTAELYSTRAGTSYRNPTNKGPLPKYACSDIPPIHIQGVKGFTDDVSPENFGPTALAIAYSSDAATLKPSDMVVISTNSTSPWWRETIYHIPADLAACPEAGCLCTWNWIHLAGNGAGYGGEIYNVLYRCKVTGAESNSFPFALGSGKVPVKCDTGAANCTKGPKQPMYLWQKAGNNMKESYNTPPTYNERYGFTNGAQPTPSFDNDNLIIDTAGSSSAGASLTTSRGTTTPQVPTAARQCAAKRSDTTD